ncbi:unnamed protein product [Amoebophrya sp. A25]|nr:unnamed protein product [Amoebophrya sp. A25]|eukprot:GSA25T00017340001.1
MSDSFGASSGCSPGGAVQHAVQDSPYRRKTKMQDHESGTDWFLSTTTNWPALGGNQDVHVTEAKTNWPTSSSMPGNGITNRHRVDEDDAIKNANKNYGGPLVAGSRSSPNLLVASGSNFFNPAGQQQSVNYIPSREGSKSSSYKESSSSYNNKVGSNCSIMPGSRLYGSKETSSSNRGGSKEATSSDPMLVSAASAPDLLLDGRPSSKRSKRTSHYRERAARGGAGARERATGEKGNALAQGSGLLCAGASQLISSLTTGANDILLCSGVLSSGAQKKATSNSSNTWKAKAGAVDLVDLDGLCTNMEMEDVEDSPQRFQNTTKTSAGMRTNTKEGACAPSSASTTRRSTSKDHNRKGVTYMQDHLGMDEQQVTEAMYSTISLFTTVEVGDEREDFYSGTTPSSSPKSVLLGSSSLSTSLLGSSTNSNIKAKKTRQRRENNLSLSTASTAYSSALAASIEIEQISATTGRVDPYGARHQKVEKQQLASCSLLNQGSASTRGKLHRTALGVEHQVVREAEGAEDEQHVNNINSDLVEAGIRPLEGRVSPPPPGLSLPAGLHSSSSSVNDSFNSGLGSSGGVSRVSQLRLVFEPDEHPLLVPGTSTNTKASRTASKESSTTHLLRQSRRGSSKKKTMLDDKNTTARREAGVEILQEREQEDTDSDSITRRRAPLLGRGRSNVGLHRDSTSTTSTSSIKVGTTSTSNVIEKDVAMYDCDGEGEDDEDPLHKKQEEPRSRLRADAPVFSPAASSQLRTPLNSLAQPFQPSGFVFPALSTPPMATRTGAGSSRIHQLGMP